MINFATWDIEAKNWNEYLISGFYDGESYQEFYSMENFMEFVTLSSDIPTTIFAHFGGIYDFNFCFDFLFSENTKALKPDSFIIQGKKVLKFSVYNTEMNKIINFVDSSGLFPFSLENLTKSFNVTHKKQKYDFENIKLDDELREYLYYDCVGLYECIEKFLSDKYIGGVGLKLTRSSMSLAVYKKFFNSKLPIIPEEIAKECREAYLGGRTEIFKPLFKKQNKKLKCYDINSLYPSVMLENDFPSTFLGNVYEYYKDSMGIYDLVVESPNLNIPLLGVKSGGKFIFPNGTFRGMWCTPEINKALSLGYKIIEVKKGYIFDNGGKMFHDFIDHFYTLRKKTKDPVKKIIYKDIMNHLYGRLAINPERDEITLAPKEGAKLHSKIKYKDYEIRFYSQKKKLWTYSNPVLSAFVTSYARLKLYSFFEKVNFDVYYCDTDSIFTTKNLTESDELGEMKLEKILNEACFLLPKSYSVKDLEGKVYNKLKGFPSKLIQNIDIKTFMECFAGELRLPSVTMTKGLVGFKTGIKKGDLLKVLPPQQKQLKAKYDKRIIIKDKNNFKTIAHKMEYQNDFFI